GHELPCLDDGLLETIVRDRVRLSRRYHPAVDAEESENLQMLMGLRPRSFASLDHEQKQVDPARSGDHVAHEALMAGNVDQRQPSTVLELERGVTKIDREAAPSLLR